MGGEKRRKKKSGGVKKKEKGKKKKRLPVLFYVNAFSQVPGSYEMIWFCLPSSLLEVVCAGLPATQSVFLPLCRSDCKKRKVVVGGRGEGGGGEGRRRRTRRSDRERLMRQ